MTKKIITLILVILSILGSVMAKAPNLPISPPTITNQVIDQLKNDLEKSAFKVDDLLVTLNAGLVALNNPQKIAQDIESLEKGKTLAKEDEVILKHVNIICASHPEFSLKKIKTNEGFIEYKKILSDYTYKVEEAMKQSKEIETTVTAAIQAYENPEQTKSLWEKYVSHKPLTPEELSFIENVGHIATLE